MARRNPAERPLDVAAMRRAAGLTQVELAELVGAHPMTVSKWERGVLRPNAHQAALLAVLGGVASGDVVAPMQALAAHLNRAFIEATEVAGMQLSASNQWKGKIVQLDEGPVSTRVVVEVAPKVRIVSVITTASARRLRLAVGKSVVAIVKATEVILGTK